jgi:HSP20 family molecular chaperone IbpA
MTNYKSTNKRLGGYSFFDDPLWSWIETATLPVESDNSQFSTIKFEKDGEEYVDIRLAAPGLRREDFTVELKGAHLTIGYSVDEKHDYSFASRKVQKTFRLPAGVQQEQISARYEDGILHVEFPAGTQKETKQAQKIDIK